jgi:hypothetical protein
LRGNLYMGLIPGKLRVRVERAGYFPEEKAILLKRGESQKVIFDLRPVPKVARLTIRNATGTEISIGGQGPQRPGADGVLTTDVTPGSQKIQFIRRGFRPVTREYSFVAGDTTNIDANTLPFERIPVTGEVVFDVTPDTAEIKVFTPDGRLITTRPGVATAYNAGRHKFQVSAPGYQDYSSNFDVRVGERQSFPFKLTRKEAPAAAAVAPLGMSGWANAKEWKLESNGYYVKKDDSQSVYNSPPGSFDFKTPCKARRFLSRGDCKVIVFLTGSERGDLRFEITDDKVRRREGQRLAEKQLASRIAAGEMRVRVQVTSSRTTLEVNGREVDSVEGDYTKGRFGINSVDEMKDFKYTPN